jgi:S-adenosylmethionine:tRNA ribosyltransferase-isomerase
VTIVDFVLPAVLEAQAPASRRDAVRMLVARPAQLRHAQFGEITQELEPGDLVVVNTSATFPGAVRGRRDDGRGVIVHFSTALEDGCWLVELRPPGRSEGPLGDVAPGEEVLLPDGVTLTIRNAQPADQARVWRADVGVLVASGGVLPYLSRNGRPIRYAYVPYAHPITDYQTVFARDPGSAEMPSAGRPFTPQIVIDLVARGVAVAPVTLHAGVSSQDSGEPPLAERYVVPPSTARLVNSTRSAGSRVVAVGTTVTRALETVADSEGTVHHGDGWTDLVLGPDRPARTVTGLLTGWHAPGASHLQLLQAVAGEHLVRDAYVEALRERYRWHEFGDSCLLLP